MQTYFLEVQLRIANGLVCLFLAPLKETKAFIKIFIHDISFFLDMISTMFLSAWQRDTVDITSLQMYSTVSELRFCEF